MRLTTRADDYVVFDDVLSPVAFKALQAKTRTLEYGRHATTVMYPEWRLEDGGQLIGPRFGLVDDEPMSSLSAEFEDALGAVTTHDAARGLIGERGSDWSAASAAAWVYPRDTMLTMHTDGRAVTGAYAFYLHDYWPVRWGGWLVIMRAPSMDFDLAVSEEAAIAAGSNDFSLGHVVVPRPNRIALVSADAHHLISRVDRLAGENLRVSLSGGFYRPA